jgi:hypothetical protein
MPATLEQRFQDALKKWIEHRRRNSLHSYPVAILDCDAYREIVSMGVNSLPLIRDQLHQEIETNKKYDNELRRLKIKVFGTDQVELFDDNYKRMCEDSEYQKYQKGYYLEIWGNPGEFWRYAVHDIIGDDFRIKIDEESPVKPRRGFVAIDVKGVMQYTFKWLDDNMHKYVPSQA